MLFFDGALGMAFLALWIFSIVDVITTPDSRCRNLPKLVWLMIVILLADIGSIAWLVAGHTWDGGAKRPLAGSRAGSPARKVASNPDDDEEFLATLRTRAEEQRRRAREAEQTKDEPERPADEA